MKKLVLITTSFFVTLVLYSIIFADSQKIISLQGRITDNTGTPVSGMGNFSFTFHDGTTNDPHISISTYVNRGLYSVNIELDRLSSSIDFSNSVSVDVEYNNTSLGTTQLAASPYAFWADSSNYAAYASTAAWTTNVSTAIWASSSSWVTEQIDGTQIRNNTTDTDPYLLFVASAVYASTAAWAATHGEDLAEIYSSKENLEPGDVVVISQDIDNNIEKSKSPDSIRVAGVIPTEPGLLMSSKEQGYQLALVGKVPVKVTNEGGSIIRGDLLTTSSIPGHAKKASNPKTGSVIGKALENFSGTKGTILVLVNLQ
ncbi:hypothetical protein [Candidatus Endomicrobiellum devescovinae]|jgi:hypothetical protein|uniref:hypothetical protein n=1 Tax=Candidatus Endomicrobiellum devescovinae TaxID=3242322 RepID=UPI002834300E|nr:hypothetical protein [Endomicrobium sp.]